MPNFTTTLILLLLTTSLIVPSIAKGGRGGGGGRGGRGSRGGTHGSKSARSKSGIWNVGSRIKGVFVKTKGHNIQFTYKPPSRLSHTCYKCTPASYPVYQPLPPPYVYEYRSSRSRFGDLFAGLALFNLGRSTVRLQNGLFPSRYVPREEEVCSMQIVGKTSFEETIIPCFMISTFTDRANGERETADAEAAEEIDITASDIDVSPYLNETGLSLDVTPEQTCVVWYNVSAKSSPSSIPCSLLQDYAETLEPPGLPLYVWLPFIILISIVLVWLCRCCKVQRDYNQIVLDKELPVT